MELWWPFEGKQNKLFFFVNVVWIEIQLIADIFTQKKTWNSVWDTQTPRNSNPNETQKNLTQIVPFFLFFCEKFSAFWNFQFRCELRFFWYKCPVSRQLYALL